MKKILLSCAVMAIAPGLYSRILHVPQDYQTIQSAIDSSSNGDTIIVEEGTYYENVDFLGKSVTLASQFFLSGDTSHISKTILDGSLAQDSIQASAVTMTGGGNSGMVLSGFTITGGSGNNYPGTKQYHGGGIFIFENGAVIEHNLITENYVVRSKGASGGLMAVLSENDTLIFSHNKVVGNQVISEQLTASGGMTVVSAKNAFIEISDNVIENNKVFTTAVYKAVGGGIYLQADYADQATIAFTRNLVSRNELHCQSSFGGGLYIVYTGTNSDPSAKSQVRIYNNIISENYSEDKGGGIAVWNTGDLHIPVEPVIANNTFINNIASDGSGLFNYDARTLAFNNIFWDSLSGDNCRDLFNSDISVYCFQDGPHWCKDKNDGVLYAMYNDVKGGWPGTGNTEVQPLFEENTFDLQKESFCIGQGIDSVIIDETRFYAPSTDFYGEPRPSSTSDYKPDLGATESPWEGYVYIPDTAFLYALIDEGVDTNGDSLISFGEAATILSLNIEGDLIYSQTSGWLSNGDIRSLKGIEAFINLVTLNCKYNDISDLDLSNHPSITFLDCGGGHITTLDVSGCEALKTLYCSGNRLTSLDLSGCNALQKLICTHNHQFTVLDVSGLMALEAINCYGNQLTSLDASGCANLDELTCDFNQLTHLDLSNDTALTYLSCSESQLTSLDISGCTALERLECFNNQLTSLDVSNNKVLTSLGCGYNQLTSLDVSNNKALKGIGCGYNQLTSLDVSGCTALEGLSCEHNQLTGLDVSNNKALVALGCGYNQLTSLDVSSIESLYNLNCSGNQLSNLDVSHNASLWEEDVPEIYSPPLYAGLYIEDMPGLYQVCVPECLGWWQECMPFDSANWQNFVHPDGSPNAYYSTECTIGVKERHCENIAIYPNPANTLLTIEAGQKDHYSVMISSLNGQFVFSKEFDGTTHQLDLSSFVSGVYFITIRSKDFVTTRKIAKF